MSTMETSNKPSFRVLMLISVILSLICSIEVEAKYVKGTISDPLSDWIFITRFCFLSDLGELRFRFDFPVDGNGQLRILLYFDDQWPSIYKNNSKTCRQKEAILNPENNQVIYLTEREGWSGCIRSVRDGEAWMQCEARKGFSSARERWWYVVASQCDGLKGLSLNYEIWMTNGPEGDTFHRQFSADEFYILEVDIAFLLAITLLLVLSVVVAVVLKNQRMFHTTFKLYMISLVFEFLHLLVMCISYGKYANDGLDNYPSKTFGRVLEAVSVLVFILMLILMAKGFTITRGRISTAGSVKIAIFMTIYVITYAILFIYEAAWFDPGLVIYLYESPAGYGLLGLRLIAWLWFCYATFFTLKHFPKKRTFYYPFFMFYTFWFWAGPIAVLVTNLRMAPWTREKIANGVFCAINFCCEAVFLFLTRPSNANKNFPYHIRTTQVGDTNAAGNDPVMATPNHTGYMPALDDSGSGPRFTDLFTVSSGRQAHYMSPPTEFLRPISPDSSNSSDAFKNGNFFVTNQSRSSS